MRLTVECLEGRIWNTFSADKRGKADEAQQESKDVTYGGGPHLLSNIAGGTSVEFHRKFESAINIMGDASSLSGLVLSGGSTYTGVSRPVVRPKGFLRSVLPS